MGLDNVLAVAGAAHGSYLLVVLGLVISVPIVVWGSTVVLKVVDRFPAVVYVGAGVLVWTAVKMILGEPLLKPVAGRAPLSGLAAVPGDPDRPVGRLRQEPSPARVAHPSPAGRVPLAAAGDRPRPPRPPNPSSSFRHPTRKAKETPRAQGPHSGRRLEQQPARACATRSTNTGAITSWSCICSTSSRACRATSPASSAAGSARPTCTTAPTRRWRARSRS